MGEGRGGEEAFVLGGDIFNRGQERCIKEVV